MTLQGESVGADVVFGGAGFIGTHLLRRLVASGSKVIAVDYRRPVNAVAGVDYRVADVRDLSSLTIEGPVRTIYNLAAIHTTPGHPTHEYYETNVLGATAICAFARQHDVAEILFTSSISVYGTSEPTKTEATPPAPTSAYGWSKLLAERIHLAWQEENEGRRLVICRPAVIFGHGEGGNFTRLAKVLKKGFFVYPGRKDTVKACFYVEDLVASFETVLDYARQSGQRVICYNGCYPDRYTLQTIVEAFQKQGGWGSKAVLVPRAVVHSAARALRYSSFLGVDIHPERVTKLVISTDVMPNWLLEHGFAERGRLASALERWSAASRGEYN